MFDRIVNSFCDVTIEWEQYGENAAIKRLESKYPGCDFSIPEYIANGKRVTKLCSCLIFSGFNSLIIPDTVEEIEERAFGGAKVKEIHLPNSIKVIPERCFAGAEISQIIIPNSVKSIEYKAFINCMNLKEVEIPDSVESVSDSAFTDCPSLKKVRWSSSCHKIPFDCFRGSSLEEISNQNNVQIIGNFAFYKTQLKSIKGFSSVKNIRSHAFTHSCINGNILLPPTCTKVERAAFSDTGICSVRSMARLFSFYVDPISWSSAFPNDIDIYLEGAEEITVNASSQLRNKNLPIQLHTGFDTDVKITYEVD